MYGDGSPSGEEEGGGGAGGALVPYPGEGGEGGKGGSSPPVRLGSNQAYLGSGSGGGRGGGGGGAVVRGTKQFFTPPPAEPIIMPAPANTVQPSDVYFSSYPYSKPRTQDVSDAREREREIRGHANLSNNSSMTNHRAYNPATNSIIKTNDMAFQGFA